ncbi:YdbH domain-containing protein [Planctomycetota bacterium]
MAEKPEERSHRVRQVCIALLIFIAIIVVNTIIFLPALVRHAAVGALAEMGVADADLEITTLSLSRARIENLTAGSNKRLHIGSIEAMYGMEELKAKRVRVIKVSDAKFTLGVTEQGVDWGPIAGLMTAESSGADLPFVRLSLKGGVFALEAGGEAVEIPFEALITNRAADDPPVTVSVKGTLPAGGTFSIGGRLASDCTGTLTAAVPTFTLQDKALLGKCIPAARDFEIGGSVKVEAAAEIGADGLVPNIRVYLTDVSVANEKSKTTVDDIDTLVIVESLTPLETAPGLDLSVKKASFGEFAADDIRAVFQLKNSDLVDVESMKCAWADGIIRGENVRFDLADKRLDISLKIEGVSMQKVMDFVYPGRVECEGSLWGMLPMSVQLGPKRRLTFGKGFLEARPQRGWVKLHEEDVKSFLGIEKIVPLEQASKEEAVKLMALQALQDMEYTHLRFEFDIEEGKGWAAHGKISGSGPRGKNTIPIGGFHQNFYGLDHLLNLLVNGIRLMPERAGDEKREEEESVEDALDAFF